MPAYATFTIASFLEAVPSSVIGRIQLAYANDGFVSQYTQQIKAWETLIPLLQQQCRSLIELRRDAASWGLLLEYPLYRLRKRIDAVVITEQAIAVIEAKWGEDTFRSSDRRQVEDYALDLRDFHAGSSDKILLPVLWCTSAPLQYQAPLPRNAGVGQVQRVGKDGLAGVLDLLECSTECGIAVAESWDAARYRPVPTIVQAATSIFAGHDVRAISNADASNLARAAHRIVEIIAAARTGRFRALIFLTGVPGSGKTLAGLQAVHDATATGADSRGDIVYLSGNTPLVVVLREALARDRASRDGQRGQPLGEARREVRTRIQHINDFLQQYLLVKGKPTPHEHAIVFDEAQRAWDAEQGAKIFNRQRARGGRRAKKFNRPPASEASLLLEIMARHSDWCACVCLVGGGQEINTGEEGIGGWGEALRLLPAKESSQWRVFGPSDVFNGGVSTDGFSIGKLPSTSGNVVDEALRLTVPLRSYRSPKLSEWVAEVLQGRADQAKELMAYLDEYPLVLTRSLTHAKMWLHENSRGERRAGLLASSGARRLRADGLGVQLGANDRDAIAHWYLNGRGDIRSSCMLEVPANEYACQGLEIDFAALCWGGDLVFSRSRGQWVYRQLNGNRWVEIRGEESIRHIRNSYRVLLTRAREGLVIWVPIGAADDTTRNPRELDETAELLLDCGATALHNSEPA